ncbi:serine hydrolase domain-containing protein [Phenylobacterium parvum]|uniref:Serine hydrolase n=1 Tax=Phenylobacterium parvum TaxID=2201350 RepID=A0A2Z3I182_9CAUL|nr:serine hydrolase domain-containing protein [Phenylobacterium parvum]AWM77508.1 serine hydrolase [Phenylobacterium parvum]
MNPDRRRLLPLPLAGLLAACTPGGARATAPEGSLLRLAEEGGVPALGGVVVGREGVIHLEVAGVRRAGSRDPVQTGDAWHLGSNTKAMTAMLYGQAVEAGKARWDSSLGELFPSLGMNAAWSKTPIDAVMEHRAGLSDAGVIDTRWLFTARSDDRSLPEQRMAMVAKALSEPPRGTPGVFAYANMNYILAGAALERIEGKPWEDVIREGLFKPLGLASAGFGAPAGDQPQGHVRLGPLPARPAGEGKRADNPAAMAPAGGVHMALADYARFLSLFLKAGDGLVSPATLARLTTPPPGGDYALGWTVTEGRAWAQGPVLGHEGSNTLWHAVAQVAPGRGLAFATVSNLWSQDKEPAPIRLLKRLRRQYAP